jgi:lysophospholipase L1-like esterase
MLETRPRLRFPDAPQVRPDRRRPAPAGKVLASMLVCFLVWSLLDARELRRSAEASSIGARRTAALAVLGPLFVVSRWTGMDTVGGWVSRALGRNPDDAPGGELAVPPVATGAPPARIVGSARRGVRLPTAGGIREYTLLPVRTPTRGNPERILVIGDSFAIGLGLGVTRSLGNGPFKVVRQGRESTGLSRPDYFDWMSQMRVDVQRYRPDIIVAMLGGNDFQDLVVPGHGSVRRFEVTQWNALYRQRVSRLMALATSGGARLVWVGLPPSRSPVLPDAGVERMNAIYQAESTYHPGVVYLDSWQLFARGGGYAAYIRLGKSHHLTQVREGDGVHFTVVGYDHLGDAVTKVMRAVLGLKT